ncbi:MAG: sensor histidine kinase [Terracidiphilus sp.]|nr:sensor histidine kinase [Terracidiphilus sp.]MDR3775915.1 sensor histidine kinase [Terracidiphilus sp.]
MQRMKQTTGLGGAERKRVEAVVETLATLHGQGESLAEVAHDARNMVTALGLYCDLLDEPGVLATPFIHYGSELRLVAVASRRLVEKLVSLETRETPEFVAPTGTVRDLAKSSPANRAADRPERNHRWDLLPAEPIVNLAGELLANRNLLAALAGPAIALTVDAESGALPVRLTGEDLTRVLVNLVKNAAEAMPAGGRIQLGLRQMSARQGASPWLQMTIEDNGPGIPEDALDKIFDSGFTTRAAGATANEGWQPAHRGLGLSITRSIVEAAGGRIHAENRTPAGARFEIELPLRTL